jgi:hypothetical protein
MKTKSIKVEYKSTQLISILGNHFGKEMNFARLSFIGLFICALYKVQYFGFAQQPTVCFERIACGLETNSQTGSSLRRIQRFIASYQLDKSLIARLIFSLLPHEPPYTLSIDRTNRKFGTTDINILVLAICHKGMAFPILFKLMPKAGNSNTRERIQLVEKYIQLFGIENISCLVADREFIGEDWINYLIFRWIEYYIRIRENFWTVNPKTGKRLKASWLFDDVGLNETDFKYQVYYVNNQLCYLSASKIKNKEGKPELQIIISFNKPNVAQKIYKERRQIETAFKALKTSGFNIEKTHLADMERIEKLLAPELIAFTWSYLLGIYLHEQAKPIKVLKHGRKAKSLFKYGLTYIAEILLSIENQSNMNVFKFLSCT